MHNNCIPSLMNGQNDKLRVISFLLYNYLYNDLLVSIPRWKHRAIELMHAIPPTKWFLLKCDDHYCYNRPHPPLINWWVCPYKTYQMLEYAGAVALTTGFTNGIGQIWLAKVACHGTESRLIDCPANWLGSHNCVHSEDAGVSCPGTVSCTHGDIRLQGGTCIQWACGGLLQQCLGHSVWWWMEQCWCQSSLQTAGILQHWLELVYIPL